MTEVQKNGTNVFVNRHFSFIWCCHLILFIKAFGDDDDVSFFSLRNLRWKADKKEAALSEGCFLYYKILITCLWMVDCTGEERKSCIIGEHKEEWTIQL